MLFGGLLSHMRVFWFLVSRDFLLSVTKHLSLNSIEAFLAKTLLYSFNLICIKFFIIETWCLSIRTTYFSILGQCTLYSLKHQTYWSLSTAQVSDQLVTRGQRSSSLLTKLLMSTAVICSTLTEYIDNQWTWGTEIVHYKQPNFT